MATKVTANGRVTIPKAVRDLLGIGPGSKVDFKRATDGSIMLVPEGQPAKESGFARFRGHARGGLSTDEIMALLRGEP